VETMRGSEGGARGASLLSVIDRTCTPMGARALRERLLAPLVDREAIVRRLDAVEALLADPSALGDLRTELSDVLDLQRLTARASCGRAHARDLVALRQSLLRLPAVVACLDRITRPPALEALYAGFDVLADVADDIGRTLVDDPPLPVKEGGLIRRGHNAELDELHDLAQDGVQWMARFQAREIERTGIQNLKVGFNRVFGYYIELTHAGSKGVTLPPDYHRKQTTKNAERYVTDELKAFENKVLRAEERSKALEYELFVALRERVAAATARLLDTATRVAELDVFAGLAALAQERGYRKPLV